MAYCRNAAAGPEEITLIEGVGGVMVPLTERETVLDWMAALGAPCLLVVGSYLGTISHTLTAAGTLAARGLDISAIVISESEESPVPVAENSVDDPEVPAGSPNCRGPASARSQTVARGTGSHCLDLMPSVRNHGACTYT